ncbi:MAG: hypothetical protein AB3X41_02560 [Leptothrix ochracea]|uniref:hypothetical protein n=1 Tax=Leptothrix ochracea TaxID=735331 RepID=UPI0034E2AA0D
MLHRLPLVSGLTLALFIVACGGNAPGPAPIGSGNGSSSVGVCVAYQTEPVFRLASAKNALTLAPIPTLTLSNVAVSGQSLDLQTVPSSLAFGIQMGTGAGANTLQCSPPCGFATLEGPYTFAVAASGYQPSTVRFDAFYQNNVGNCPLHQSGPTVVDLVLQPL